MPTVNQWYHYGRSCAYSTGICSKHLFNTCICNFTNRHAKSIMSVTIHVLRSSGQYATFQVPYHEGMSALDALKAISQTQPDLAYRYECGGQAICGVCTALINGRPMLACAAHIHDEQSYTLAPLPGHPVDKDLLVEFGPRLERFMRAVPYLTEGGKPIESKAAADASRLLRSCIECWACVAVCPVSLTTDHADALSMVKLARFALDPRDGTDRVQLAAALGLVDYEAACPSCRACQDICPKHIDVYAHAVRALLNLQAEAALPEAQPHE
jgi:succinate dehydrogenase/fumarate reductase iron-sulfur protein